MGNLNVNFTLTALRTAKLCKAKNGHDAVLIDLVDEPGVTFKDGKAYYNLTALERKEPGKYGETHFLKPYVSGDAYKSMSEEDRKNLPIVGNVRPAKDFSKGSKEEPVELIDDDLPF